jgi:hypothetical protein
MLEGGWWELFIADGPYDNSTTLGRVGNTEEIPHKRRVSWHPCTRERVPEDIPDLEIIVRSQRNEEMWRNAFSVQLDQEMWPTLTSTPRLVRLAMRGLKLTPVVGNRMWRKVISWVLWLQMLLIFDRFGYRTWCGKLDLLTWWPTKYKELPPKWVQDLDWNSAEMFNRFWTKVAQRLAGPLGLKDGYPEYYLAALWGWTDTLSKR